ncbi:Tripartite motif-containing protein 16 Estrogen-responsive B box protein [Channa argus]|uniref:Tripartite motif-containing protein 16 Estrogen-responsive B box protein n=1 Tax=Channa argus TaxID=215402 RepID=A0A6G1PI23_CHAAH|nr:Tripartite motif-containing protein 16 Estrogen-responsive B box protein [Channa argus]
MAEPFIPVTINHLCCRICNELLRTPVTVPCGHNFCMRCIEDSWNQNESRNFQYSCPECLAIFPFKPPLIRNTTLDQLVKDTQNLSKKRKQQDLRASLKDLKRFRSCTKTGTPGTICERHNWPLDVYCCTDELIICAMCALDKHQRHRTARVEIERERKQVELQKMQGKFKEILQQQEKIRNNAEKIFEQIPEEAKQTKDSCESVVVNVIDSLQEHYLSVKNLIEAQEAAAAAHVQVTLQALEAKMKVMKKTDAELDCLAKTKSDVDFLQEYYSVRRTVAWFKNLRLVNPSAVSFLAAMAFITGLPEVNCAVTEQNVEPETRAQFLQYACELTLNPATAHEDLVVSEGDKEVTMRPQVSKCPSIRYPERFVHRRQVLCREGLEAERCYYKIEVEGDKVEIALAYKTIDRKTRNKMSAFGGNAISWSLDRSKNYSVSNNNTSVQLTTSPSHPKIGIYLKFKEGTLSFYEVSDSMKFLYMVKAKFTESLYPGFWLGEKSCIRICDLRQD